MTVVDVHRINARSRCVARVHKVEETITVRVEDTYAVLAPGAFCKIHGDCTVTRVLCPSCAVTVVDVHRRRVGRTRLYEVLHTVAVHVEDAYTVIQTAVTGESDRDDERRVQCPSCAVAVIDVGRRLLYARRIVTRPKQIHETVAIHVHGTHAHITANGRRKSNRQCDARVLRPCTVTVVDVDDAVGVTALHDVRQCIAVDVKHINTETATTGIRNRDGQCICLALGPCQCSGLVTECCCGRCDGHARVGTAFRHARQQRPRAIVAHGIRKVIRANHGSVFFNIHTVNAVCRFYRETGCVRCGGVRTRLQYKLYVENSGRAAVSCVVDGRRVQLIPIARVGERDGVAIRVFDTVDHPTEDVRCVSGIGNARCGRCAECVRHPALVGHRPCFRCVVGVREVGTVIYFCTERTVRGIRQRDVFQFSGEYRGEFVIRVEVVGTMTCNTFNGRDGHRPPVADDACDITTATVVRQRQRRLHAAPSWRKREWQRIRIGTRHCVRFPGKFRLRNKRRTVLVRHG